MNKPIVGLAYLEQLKRAEKELALLCSDPDTPQHIFDPSRDMQEKLNEEIVRQSLALTGVAILGGTKTLGTIMVAPCSECGHTFLRHVDGGACADPKCWCGEYKSAESVQVERSLRLEP